MTRNRGRKIRGGFERLDRSFDPDAHVAFKGRRSQPPGPAARSLSPNELDTLRTPAAESDTDFSPVENELPLRWYRQAHLVPADGFGTVRRAVFFALLTWLPIVVWAAVDGRLISADAGEPLLRHFGVHVRCLLAIPLLILAEAALHGAGRRLASQFASSGIVGPEQRIGFEQATRDVRRLRNSSLPWVFVLGAAIAWSLANHPALHEDAMSWAVGVGRRARVRRLVVRLHRATDLSRAGVRLRSGACYCRTMDLEGRSTGSVAGADASRPHRRNGVRRKASRRVRDADLGAVRRDRFPLGARSRLSRRDAAVIHASCGGVRHPVDPVCAAAASGAGAGADRARGRAIPAYATLVGEQGRLVHRRWILGETVEDAPFWMLPEIGPLRMPGRCTTPSSECGRSDRQGGRSSRSSCRSRFR